jgi:hypothetical protein
MSLGLFGVFSGSPSWLRLKATPARFAFSGWGTKLTLDREHINHLAPEMANGDVGFLHA